MGIYGSLQGPPIPESVDFEKLPLGKHAELEIRSVSERDAKKGDSKNASFLVVSTDKKIRGTGFFRINFRHTTFSVGPHTFGANGGYLDPKFRETGLDILEELSQVANDIGKQAGSELARARLALSAIKRLNEWGGFEDALLDTGSAAKKSRHIGTVFSGSVSFTDSEFNRQRKKADGTFTFRTKKGEDIPEGSFDHSTSQADVAIDKFKAPPVVEGNAQKPDPDPDIPF